ncbi:MAG: LamG domain-containing protein, partial [Candidatus Omnitrophica bacterium]|nr:LamG domain-containing protein [Candidatus Omnitrophota bacterium]
MYGLSAYGGGGGSGGAIFLQGGTVSISGSIIATAGTGGAGLSPAGGAGGNGRIRLDSSTQTYTQLSALYTYINPDPGYTACVSGCTAPPPSIPSGTFESASINLGATTYSFNTLGWNATVPNASLGGGISTEVPNTTSGLVGLWHLNESSGTTTVDSVGGYTGTLTTMTTTSLAGNGAGPSGWNSDAAKFNNALKFDGTDDYVTTATSPTNLNVTNNFTFEAWVNPTDFSASQAVFVKGNVGTDTGNEYEWYLVGSTGQVMLSKNNVGTVTSTGSIPAGQWSHIAVTFATGSTIFYINGVAGSPQTAAFTTFGSNTETLLIGRRSWSTSSQYFKGLIDEVAIYNRVLTASEIKSHAGMGFALQLAANTDNATWNYVGPDGTASTYFTQPVALWHLNETSGTTAADASGNGNTGTFTSSGSSYLGPTDAEIAGWSADSHNETNLNAVNFTMPATAGTMTSISAYVMNVAGGFQFQVGLYSNKTSGCAWSATKCPDLLLAKSNASTTPTNNAWNSILTSSLTYSNGFTGALSANTSYWLVYNVGGTTPTDDNKNNLKIATGSSGQYCWLTGTALGTWPSPFGTPTATPEAFQVSIRANYTTASGVSFTTGPTNLNGAYSFDGTAGYASAADSASLSPTAAMTVEGWIDPAALATGKAIITKWAASNPTFYLQLDPTTSTELRIVVASASTDTLTTYYGYTTGAALSTAAGWYHVAFVFDGSQTGNANRLKLYLNGSLKTLSFTGSGTIPATLFNGTATVQLGGNTAQATYFNGSIDEVAVYDRALTQAEVTARYNAGAGREG